MKRGHWIVLATALSLTACQYYVQADAVLPPASAVASVEIVSGPPDFPPTRKSVEPLMSFLRDGCHWTPSKPGDRDVHDYAVVIHLSDGQTEVIEVGDRELVLDGYRSHLSQRAADRLDALCGMGRVLLSPFQTKGR